MNMDIWIYVYFDMGMDVSVYVCAYVSVYIP